MHIFKNNSKEDKAVCSSGCGSNGSDIDTNKVRKPLFLEGKPVFKVLGSGCRKCHDQYDILQKTISELNIDAEIEYITDLQKVMEYGIMSTPAIVLNDNVISYGRVLKGEDLIEIIENSL